MSSMMPTTDFEHVNVLLVDYEEHTLSLLRDMLRSLGVNDVFTAPNGERALEMLEDPMGVVLCAYNIPKMNGLEFAKAVRALEDNPNRSVPIILIAGHAERELVMEARDSGITEFLIKPLSQEALELRLRAVIDNPRPFVDSTEFAGPDRRRRVTPTNFYGPERRSEDSD